MRSTQWNFSYFVVRARRRSSVARRAPPPLSLFVPRQIRYRVIFQRDYINCPGDAGAPLITGAIAVMSLDLVIQPRTREVFLFSKVNAITRSVHSFV